MCQMLRDQEKLIPKLEDRVKSVWFNDWALVRKPKFLNDVKLRPSKKVFKINIRVANKEIQKETGETKGYQKEKRRSWRDSPVVKSTCKDPDLLASTHKVVHNLRILVPEDDAFFLLLSKPHKHIHTRTQNFHTLKRKKIKEKEVGKGAHALSTELVPGQPWLYSGILFQTKIKT